MSPFFYCSCLQRYCGDEEEKNYTEPSKYENRKKNYENLYLMVLPDTVLGFLPCPSCEALPTKSLKYWGKNKLF